MLPVPCLAPAPGLVPPRALERQRAPRRPGGAAQSPSRFAAHGPPRCSSGSHGPGRGAGHRGCGRTPPRVLTSARASVRPSSVCCWDCGAGEAPTDADRASPPPRAPRPYGGPERGRRDQGTGAAPAGGGGSCGARWGGAGASAGPRREGTWERLSSRTKEAGEGSEPPGPGPELELVLDTSSGRWRGNPSELGRRLIRSPHVPGRERARAPPALGAGRDPSIPRCPRAPVRPKVPRTRGPGFSRPPGRVRVRARPLGLRPGGVGRGPAPPPPDSHPTLGPGRSRGCAGLAGFSARRVGGSYSAAN